MKNLKWILLMILMITAIGIVFWGHYDLINYNGFGDPSEYTRFKDYLVEARRAAMPKYLTGIGIMVVAYILTYIPSDK